MNTDNQRIVIVEPEGTVEYKDLDSDYHYHNREHFPLLLLSDRTYFLQHVSECQWLFEAIGTLLFNNEQVIPYRDSQLLWQVVRMDENEVFLYCVLELEEKRWRTLRFVIYQSTNFDGTHIWTQPTIFDSKKHWICL